MSKSNEPAFPDPLRANPHITHVEPHPGMTLRDYFAAKAMIGIVVLDGTVTDTQFAVRCYEIADAMMDARLAK